MISFEDAPEKYEFASSVRALPAPTSGDKPPPKPEPTAPDDATDDDDKEATVDSAIDSDVTDSDEKLDKLKRLPKNLSDAIDYVASLSGDNIAVILGKTIDKARFRRHLTEMRQMGTDAQKSAKQSYEQAKKALIRAKNESKAGDHSGLELAFKEADIEQLFTYHRNKYVVTTIIDAVTIFTGKIEKGDLLSDNMDAFLGTKPEESDKKWEDLAETEKWKELDKILLDDGAELQAKMDAILAKDIDLINRREDYRTEIYGDYSEKITDHGFWYKLVATDFMKHIKDTHAQWALDHPVLDQLALGSLREPIAKGAKRFGKALLGPRYKK